MASKVVLQFPISRLALIAVCVMAVAPTTLRAFAVQLGDPRQTVIETYGYPKSRAEFDAREIFNYNEGGIVLENGRVIEIRFSKGEPRNLRSQATARAPAPSATTPQKPKSAPVPAPESVRLAQPQAPLPVSRSSQLEKLEPLLWLGAIVVALRIAGGLFKKIQLRGKKGLNPAGTGSGQSARGVEDVIQKATPQQITQLTREAMDRLEWRKFEELTQAYFEKIGWLAKRSAVGADGGIDIFLEKAEPEKITACVQCKQRSNEIIGVKYIREFFGVMVSEGITEGYFVTTNMFSDDAIRFAQGKRIHLISGDELLRLYASLPKEQHEAAVRHAFRDDFETPTCPSCDLKMVRRHGGTGFWGCRNFPRCRRTLTLRMR